MATCNAPAVSGISAYELDFHITKRNQVVFFHLQKSTACDSVFLSPRRSCALLPRGCSHVGNSGNVFNEAPFSKSPRSVTESCGLSKGERPSFPHHLVSATDQLAQETRLSKTEVDCWFLERRALRDNMEKVLLTMACRNTEDRLERAGGALLNGASHREQDRKTLLSSPHPPPSYSSSSSSSTSPPVLAASSPQPPTHSSSRSPPILNSSSPHPPLLPVSSSPSPISSRTLALLREVRSNESMSLMDCIYFSAKTLQMYAVFC